MKSVKPILLALLILGFINSNAQEITRNNVYLEIAGASMFYSVNYERVLLRNTENNIAVRIGGMYLPTKNDGSIRQMSGSVFGISYLKRITKNFFEIGCAASAIYDTYDLTSGTVQDLAIIRSVRAGIRHQPREKGLYWNALAQISLVSFGDVNDFRPDHYFLPFASFGIGYGF